MRIGFEGVEATAGTIGVEAGGVVEEEAFVALSGTLGVGEVLLIDLSKQHQGVVGKYVVGIEVDEALEEAVGIGVALLAYAYASLLEHHLVEQGVGERAGSHCGEALPGSVELVAVEQQVGSGIEFEEVEGAICLHIVADKQRELHGIVGDKL